MDNRSAVRLAGGEGSSCEPRMGRPDLQHVGGIAKSDQPVLDASPAGPAEGEGARFNRIRNALFHGELRVGAILHVALRANISLRSARPPVTPGLVAN